MRKTFTRIRDFSIKHSIDIYDCASTITSTLLLLGGLLYVGTSAVRRQSDMIQERANSIIQKAYDSGREDERAINREAINGQKRLVDEYGQEGTGFSTDMTSGARMVLRDLELELKLEQN